MKKIAIITGASSGMGKDFALQIAKNYKDVCNELWLIARRKENLENLAKEKVCTFEKSFLRKLWLKPCEATAAK